MITEQELRDALAARAGDAPDNPDRLAQVRTGVRVATNRRRGLVVLLAGLVALAVVVPLVSRHPAHPLAHGDFLTPGEAATHVGSAAATPSVTPTPMVVNPEYAGGGRRIGAGAVTSPAHGTLTYTFVPTSYALYLTDTCTDDQTSVAVSVNGHQNLDGDCGGVSGEGAIADPVESTLEWDHQVVLGHRNTVTVTIIAGLSGTGIHPLGASQRRPGTVASAIYQGIPFEDYPLPPRPATVAAPQPYGTDASLLGPGAAVNGTFTTTVAVGSDAAGRQLQVATSGPGLLSLAVAGHHVLTFGAYTWGGDHTGVQDSPDGLAEFGLHVVAGQRVTVTVTTRHFTGPYWELAGP